MCTLQNPNFPKWVQDMINAQFITGKGNDPSYRGYFCVDCGGKSLSNNAVETHHCGHNVLQALSCSREYGYNIYDVKKIPHLLDIFSGVCPYKVNNGFVYFPRSRNKCDKKKSKEMTCGSCVVCRANLSRPGQVRGDLFCSILCKLNSGKGLFNAMMLQENEVCLNEIEKDDNKGLDGLVKAALRDRKNVENGLSFRKKSRKGTPCRAPLPQSCVF